ncbi:MAG: malate/lactate/ureidoglycolate dehydrogenase [Gammaproteobacteria bacterium]|nr:malate/lactate/ureidoglycolate dehydrogenase [Gammaproteobacteria bacterium]
MLINHEKLKGFAQAVFERLGAQPDKAFETADHLVEANLKGHDSHGVGMIPNYVGSALRGGLQVNADARVVKDQGAVLLVDGGFGFGQVVGRQATDLGIEKAKAMGIACIGSRNNHHLGRIGSYAEQCVAAGMVSIHFVNVVGHPPFVSMWGGRDKRLQTNPFCCGVPTESEPLILDMATSAIALGKVRVADMKNELVPENALFDAAGRPTRDPAVIAEGGSLGPFGQHKGSGLALMCELLGGALAGEWTMQDIDQQKEITVNHMLMLILDPNVFGGVQGFRREVAGMQAYARSAAPAEGFDEVRLPGDPERASQRERLSSGIPIDPQSWSAICEAAENSGLTSSEIAGLVD